MVKKTIILLILCFCSFTLLVCGEKNILPNLTNRKEPEPVFLAPWSRSRSKKNIRSQSRFGKNQEPEPDEKKVRSRSRSPALVII